MTGKSYFAPSDGLYYPKLATIYKNMNYKKVIES